MISERIREGIITYLWTRPQTHRSLQSIDSLCKYLCWPVEQDYRKKARKAIRSLLVQGVIEFLPKNNIRLSPSNALTSRNKLLLTNPPFQCIFRPLGLLLNGTSIVPRTQETIDHLKRTGIPIRRFSLQPILTSTASLESIISTWDKAKLIDTETFQVWSDRGWVHSEKATPNGIYRVSPHPYSQCYLKYGGCWFTIPRREDNIDGFQIAAFLNDSESIRQRMLLLYEPDKAILTVKIRHLPLIIERLLFINTALGENPNADIHARKYAVSAPAVRHLNYILNDTITTI